MKPIRLHTVPTGSAAEAAAYWVMRLDSPGCAPSDRAAFEKWRATHPSHAWAYAKARRALAAVDQHLGSAELTGLGERVFRETGKTPRPLRRYAGIGCALACSLILGVMLYPPNADAPGIGPEPRFAASTFETAVGERSTVGLPDDSSVTLNTDTVVEVRFVENSDVRRLVLVRGQAHFEVAKDPRPFEVLAGGRRIVAMGTAFDVRIDPQLGVRVTLLEGRVAVDEGIQDATALSPCLVCAGPVANHCIGWDSAERRGAADCQAERTAEGSQRRRGADRWLAQRPARVPGRSVAGCDQ